MVNRSLRLRVGYDRMTELHREADDARFAGSFHDAVEPARPPGSGTTSVDDWLRATWHPGRLGGRRTRAPGPR